MKFCAECHCTASHHPDCPNAPVTPDDDDDDDAGPDDYDRYEFYADLKRDRQADRDRSREP